MKSDNSQRTVLITGANGRFGTSAGQAFLRAGFRVLAQVRRDLVPELAGAIAVRVDIDDVDALVSAAAGAVAVIHAVNPPYERWETEALLHLKSAVEVARRLGAHVLLPGNVYNFGEGMPASLREDTAMVPSTRKGAIRVEMEREMERLCASAGIPGTVIRAGDFFGGGTGSWFDLAIVKSARQRKLVYPGPLDVIHAWAYLPDLARMFVDVVEEVLARPRAGLARLHFAGYTLTGAELLDGITRAAATLGVAGPFRVGRMPWTLIRILGTFHARFRELAKMAYLWRVPHALVGPSSSSTTPLDTALARSLQALGIGATHIPGVRIASDSLG